jgi:protein-disulfide isomerase
MDEPVPPVAVVPRAVFNYIVIAIVFFVLGAGVTILGYNGLFDSNKQENEDLISQAVERAVNEALDARDAAAAAQAQQENGPVQGEFYTVSADNDPFVGAEDAPVVIVEFSDFNCTYCSRFYNETLALLLEAYGDKIRFVYRDFPILAQSSVTASLAAECAYEQGNFWDYHNVLFENRGQFSRDQLVGYAESLGLDTEQFGTCLDNQQYQDEVVGDFRDAQTLGIRGTPSFFVNGQFVSGAQPFAVFATAIDEALAKLDGLDTPAG